MNNGDAQSPSGFDALVEAQVMRWMVGVGPRARKMIWCVFGMASVSMLVSAATLLLVLMKLYAR